MRKYSDLLLLVVPVWVLVLVLSSIFMDTISLFYIFLFTGIILFSLLGSLSGTSSISNGISVSIGDIHQIQITSLGNINLLRKKLGGKWDIRINSDDENTEKKYKEEVKVDIIYDDKTQGSDFVRMPIYYFERKGEALAKATIGYVELQISFSEIDLFYDLDIPSAKLKFHVCTNREISTDIYNQIFEILSRRK